MAQKVLVVDDDPAVVQLVSDALTDAGFAVSSAVDGEGCLASLRDDPPDLVVLDIILPGMSGLTALTAIRSAPETRHLPVILLTARDQPEDKVSGWMSGADRYITKPFSTQSLLAAVQHVLHPPPAP